MTMGSFFYVFSIPLKTPPSTLQYTTLQLLKMIRIPFCLFHFSTWLNRSDDLNDMGTTGMSSRCSTLLLCCIKYSLTMERSKLMGLYSLYGFSTFLVI
ncbi:hypothetical protein TNCT_91741 [Trichonephila clavata]|uniref:Uncharacterized protein n=1 Tax=Trichonephila clavata TaxID=2740835 RepID=A0A8X6G0B1_TRICU|nr:hypothetical protein TNCT_91741 [Trichonephila clavata]